MPEAIVPAIRLVIIKGASFREVLTWKSGGVLVPLPSGTTAEMKIRPKLLSDTVLARFSTSPGATDGLITLSDPGLTILTMEIANTALLTAAKDAVFDIRYVFAGNNVVIKLDNGQGICDIRTAATRT